MNSDNDFITSVDAFDEVKDSDDNATLSSTMSIQNNSETDEFITPPKNFGIHWMGFLRSKQVKNTKLCQYNAKCLYSEDKILYMQNINKKNSANIIKSCLNKDLDISSKKHKAVLTDFFNKTMILSDKIDKLHTLLLRSLIYSNVAFQFVENPFFALFLNKLYSSYNLPSRYTLTYRIMQAEYAKVLSEMIDHLEEVNDLTLSFDEWTDVLGNSIYAFLLNKFENINEVINIEDFFII
ncbi:648_t:CDS:2 [Dentiscutata heterogama]|uniref:648_t:CDS:1 n=1 Tax=Dentiscutata heterogama TaxID=1316150 RepID=A0ACA9K514_9GLOM|nr:648_t:CDS:2 [Dentiscutata heterogama]